MKALVVYESLFGKVRQGATQGSTTVGLREWLEHLLTGPHSELVATFDTRGWPRFVICQARPPRVPQRSRSGSVMRRPRRPRASLSRPSVARCWRASWVCLLYTSPSPRDG